MPQDASWWKAAYLAQTKRVKKLEIQVRELEYKLKEKEDI